MQDYKAIFKEIDKIKEAGHIVLIKFDGEREKEKITVVLSLLNGERQVIQRHGDDMLTLLNKLLADYHNLCSKN